MDKKIINRSHIEPKGEVYRQAISSQILKDLLEAHLGINLDESRYIDGIDTGIISYQALCRMAFKAGINKEEFKKIHDKAVKYQFADNFIWRFLKKKFNKDIAIPFVTGFYTKRALKANLVVTTGHAGYAGQIGGVTSTAFTAVAYGTGATAPAAADTALQTETARGAATITRVTTSVANDTCQWVKTFTAAGTVAITEEGILDNNSTGGNLLARNTFSAVNLVLNDTIQFTHKIQS